MILIISLEAQGKRVPSTIGLNTNEPLQEKDRVMKLLRQPKKGHKNKKKVASSSENTRKIM